jgi:uncharacterized protein YecE (DUF72 family)
MVETPQYLVGTSGWSYPHWKGLFYPEDWPKNKWFEYYATQFRTVEVNATFYRTFRDQTYQKWFEKAPDHFSYVLKVPRLITHRKYLINVEESIKMFWRSITLLRDKFGLVLLQLAPSTPFDPDRLQKALHTFENPNKVAVEFRHPQWFTEEIKMLLKESNAVFCTADSPKTELMDWVTAETAYIRLHGHENWYGYDYSTKELERICRLAQKMNQSGAKTVYIFFNNDVGGFAPKNASTLIRMLQEL